MFVCVYCVHLMPPFDEMNWIINNNNIIIIISWKSTFTPSLLCLLIYLVWIFVGKTDKKQQTKNPAYPSFINNYTRQTESIFIIIDIDFLFHNNHFIIVEKNIFYFTILPWIIRMWFWWCCLFNSVVQFSLVNIFIVIFKNKFFRVFINLMI